MENGDVGVVAPRRMLQPPKDSIREAFAGACRLVEKKQDEISKLRAQLQRENGAIGIALAAAFFLGALAAAVPQSWG